MQMGANYTKKMAVLKPQLKLIKMLENNDLLSSDKLNNLIDLAKRDPKAIAKLLKDSNIEPLEIDTDDAADYRPTDYSVSDRDFKLGDAIDSIKDTPTFDKTINVLTKLWDVDSKAVIRDNPSIIGVVNEHMESGAYDRVNTEMQRERMLGNLEGISDVEAYLEVAKSLAESDASKSNSDNGKSSKVSSDKSKSTAKRDKARKAVAPVRQSGKPSTKVTEDNSLAMSDEEFKKQNGL